MKKLILKKIRESIVLPNGDLIHNSLVLFLNNPHGSEAPASLAPDNLYDVFGTDPYRRSLAFAKVEGMTIQCPMPDPFVGTKLEDILLGVTSGIRYDLSLCGFNQDRIWLTALGCAMRGLRIRVLKNLCGSFWAYELQGDDRVLNSNIVYDDEEGK